jgi:nitrite reductase (NADH) small subunit
MERVVVATLDDIPMLRGRSVMAGGIEIALFRLSNGEIKAIENSCPHKQGKLSEGIVCDNHVYCPLHDWKINVNDGIVQAPDEGCVHTFEVEVNAATGEIAVLIEQSISGIGA